MAVAYRYDEHPVGPYLLTLAEAATRALRTEDVLREWMATGELWAVQPITIDPRFKPEDVDKAATDNPIPV